MEKLVKDHYTGSMARDYNAKRMNGKWFWEQKIIEDFIKNNSDIKTVIDAPLGTNRFNKVLEHTDHVKAVYGYELSDDMIAEAKNQISTKLEVFKWDLVNDPIDKSADLTIIYRMLNLFVDYLGQSNSKLNHLRLYIFHYFLFYNEHNNHHFRI